MHHIMQVYADKLNNGKNKKEQPSEENLTSGNDEPVSKADSQVISERIIKDITGRINNICKTGIEPKTQALNPLQGAWLTNEPKKETIASDLRFPVYSNRELQTSGLEPASGMCKDKEISENKKYVYNAIDNSGKKVSREISLIDSGFLIKNP